MSSEWISVKERLPDGYRDVLATDENRQYHICRWTGMHFDHPVYKHERFTHWMPLPRLPEPQLTVKEALREAVYQLELIHKMGRRHNGERLTDRGGYYIEATYMKDSADALPRLRAALEAE